MTDDLDGAHSLSYDKGEACEWCGKAEDGGLDCPGPPELECPNGPGVCFEPASLPVRSRSVRYPIVIDPTLGRRGEVDVEGKRIVLREWDEEVLLHECLHALLDEGGFITHGGYGPAPIRVVNTDEEAMVQHVSHGLYEMGWRLATERVLPEPTP